MKAESNGHAAAAEVQPILLEGGEARGGLLAEEGSGHLPTFMVGEKWWQGPVMKAALKNLGLILLWYFLGTSLSLWNKKLLGKEHGLFGKGAFPAPFLMSSLQFFCQHLIAKAVLAARPPHRRRGEDLTTWEHYFKQVVPNGIATGLDIGLSNYSLVFITLSFYVMCKSTTPIFLLIFAIAWGIEKPSWSLAGVVLTITAGLLLLVAGETRFDLTGFVLVMTAAMLAGLRWTITQVLLQGDPSKAHGGGSGGTGAVEVIYQLTPIMGITLGVLSLGFERLWDTLPASPYFETPGHVALSGVIMLFGGLIAYMMVWAEFTLIANTSALTFMVAGTFKEIVTVGAAVLFLGESFTWVNACGLVVLLAGVALFNLQKLHKLKHGEIRGTPLEEPGSGGSKGSETGEEEGEAPLRLDLQAGSAGKGAPALSLHGLEERPGSRASDRPGSRLSDRPGSRLSDRPTLEMQTLHLESPNSRLRKQIP